ncbi:pyridoxamine 5'-phosphate oxidase family protein [Sutcliffiella horikoshii]|uniref:pyridoxamine 5'-phosphate oxidase family protein n=1 Tax=Sutcliffiella horikoshii TaxID=79883 RepID=UPI00203CA67A|nr:pyridoxamine 5'-phosphate oxidase family protein [Sutcliffiella horikoshii]MCM3616410.1 pyridoxamine 5'-phosphate oxidase family protein [Sutcliffiella horikoshii]
MPNLVENVLVDPLKAALQKEILVTISTVDYESGGPNVSAISWLYAPDEKSILLAVNAESRIVKNVIHNNELVVNLMANDSVYAIHTKATVKVEKMEELPLKLALLHLEVKEVRDVMFYGAKISVEPRFEKTYDKDAAKKLDHQVMTAIRKYE